MAKSFLILMLAVTQLLAGSGESVYVCIRNDGSFCSIDRGTADCSRCTEQDVVSIKDHTDEILPEQSHKGCECCSRDCDAEPSCGTDKSLNVERVVESIAVSAESIAVSNAPCGCTRILLLSREDSSVCATQPAPMFDANRLNQASFDVPALFGSDVATQVHCAAFQRFKPPPITAQTIVVMSWVLIQC